ncbi:MAG TPA: PAS domain S-box protein [Thermoanaerobaculia bacterium]|jgi:PAS domain S-box-containing protein|nr:PAS domain S-box protein [Thermoanaerobaculia bacterium]
MKGSPPLPPIEDTELVLEELFRHTPVGVVLTDLHGTIVDVNPALCEMVGYQRTELIGHTVTEISHPDDLSDVLMRAGDLREGRTGHYVVHRRYVARSGKVIQAKVTVSLVNSKDSEAVCGIAFIENITDRTTMEAELRQSEMRYRRVVEDQTELIVRCLPDGTRTFVNEAYCRYNDATAAELIGTSFFTCMNDKEQKSVRAKFAALSPSNPVITDQHWVVGPTGAMRWHEWTDRGFFDAEGRLIEIQSVGRDLTEQHEADQRVVRSEERYRRLFSSLPIAAWESDWSALMPELRRRGLDSAEALTNALRGQPDLFFELGRHVSVVGVNPVALEMAGVTTLEEFRTWTAWLPDSARRYGLALPQLIYGERKFITDEFTLIRSNGEPLEVLFRVARSERWGEEWMMFPIAVDISDRKRIQLELEHKQELTERAEAAAHLGSWEWNPVEDMIYGSVEFWRILDGRHGGGPQERPLQQVLALLHAEDAAAAAALWSNLRAPSTEPRPYVIDSDFRLVRADGSITLARGQTFGTFAPDGSMIRAFGILRDITDARRAEEEGARHRDELVRADKMISLGILVSGMAHEINNPNHSIGLNAPLVRNAWHDAAELLDEIAEGRPDLRVSRMPWSEARREVASMLDDIEHASERIRNIVTELRGFALDHDAGERHNVSVNDIVTSSLRLLGKHIARATKDFKLELADDEPVVLGNARRLEQVVVNLVINACQALQRDDQAIRLSTGVEAQRAYIRVRDEGCGIAAQDLPKVRTPFFTTKRTAGGTGLGLAVSDRIAGEHGGELTFESEVGRGTTATLWLPLGRT